MHSILPSRTVHTPKNIGRCKEVTKCAPNFFYLAAHFIASAPGAKNPSDATAVIQVNLSSSGLLLTLYHSLIHIPEHTHRHTLFLQLPGCAGTRKVNLSRFY